MIMVGQKISIVDMHIMCSIRGFEPFFLTKNQSINSNHQWAGKFHSMEHQQLVSEQELKCKCTQEEGQKVKNEHTMLKKKQHRVHDQQLQVPGYDSSDWPRWCPHPPQQQLG